MQEPTLTLNGAGIWQGWLDRPAQEAVLKAVREVVAQAPLVQPVTRSGRAMSVRMSAAGRLGWVSDRRGYRYEPRHVSGVPWPPIPEPVLAVWQALAGVARAPDCCLINYYGEGARMGLHQDRDEGDFSWPVLSISLGDEALFRIGSATRGGPTRSLWLKSGDVLTLGGAARLAWHGIDRLRFGSSDLLPQHGRINLTLRVVDQGTTG